jgi:hypothetical protein
MYHCDATKCKLGVSVYTLELARLRHIRHARCGRLRRCWCARGLWVVSYVRRGSVTALDHNLLTGHLSPWSVDESGRERIANQILLRYPCLGVKLIPCYDITCH